LQKCKELDIDDDDDDDGVAAANDLEEQ